MSWGSSVSTMYDCRLDDQGLIPGRTKDFSSSLCVNIESGAAHPAYLICTRGPPPGGKVWLRRDADHTPPSSAEVKNEYELYLLSRQAPSWCVVG
jgi:hypothetical protein